MKPTYQVSDVVYHRINRDNVGQVVEIVQKHRTFVYRVKLADLNIEEFEEFELTKTKSEALEPIGNDDDEDGEAD